MLFSLRRRENLSHIVLAALMLTVCVTMLTVYTGMLPVLRRFYAHDVLTHTVKYCTPPVDHNKEMQQKFGRGVREGRQVGTNEKEEDLLDDAPYGMSRFDPDYKHPVTGCKRQLSELPRLAIVIPESIDGTKTYSTEHASVLCYGMRHGIPIFIDTFVPSKERHFFRTRIKTIQKYLPFYQWVLMLDGDQMFVNYTRSFEEFLDDRFDVLGNRRDNGEINANFIVKNSKVGWEFLDRMYSIGERPGRDANYDNGDLHDAVIEHFFADVEERKKCQQYRNSDYMGYVRCFNDILKEAPVERQRQFKWYRTYQGFMRNFEGYPDATMNNAHPHKWLFPGDFIVHGKFHWRFLKKSDVHCTDIPANGITNPDMWLTIEDARHFVSRHGREYAQDYKYCWENGVNVCLANYEKYSK